MSRGSASYFTQGSRLIVSCQALSDEPLHSSFIMGRMALSAAVGGACGIRANSVEDIAAIKDNVDLPIIGIIKRDYDDSPVYITPTMAEVADLVDAGVAVIAMDATASHRPGGVALDSFFAQVKRRYPDQLFMADCSTVEEALHADELGFDYIGTTLVGYTDASRGADISADDFAILRDVISKVSHPVIAEGNFDTPKKARRALELGACAVVVGSIITRPQVITKRFVDEMIGDQTGEKADMAECQAGENGGMSGVKKPNRPAYQAEGSRIVGDVLFGSDSSVWHNAVIRGDVDTIEIGEKTNIQDNCVLHVDEGFPIKIGAGVTVGHGCILHGCRIGDNTLIGMGSTILNGARIGSNCVIGAGSLVTQNKEIPEGMLAFGNPAKVIRPLSEEEIAANRSSADHYVKEAVSLGNVGRGTK